MKRRKFAKNSTLAIGSLMMLRCKAEATVKEAKEAITSGAEKFNEKILSDFGLQLWSVRGAMEEDSLGTLKQLSDIGYTDIESAGYKNGAFYDMSPKDFKKALSDLGMKMRSSHTKTGYGLTDFVGSMTNGWEQALNDAKEVGAQSIVLGWISEDERKSIDDYKRLSELLNKCGEVANSYGIKLGYHNHDFEFFKFGEDVPYDLLLNNTDADKVFFEMDHYWVKKGDANTHEYFEKYPGRFPVWHVKDMDDTEEQFFTEVGSGIIDYVDIFKRQELAGLRYFYVEQDEYKNIEPIASVEKSHDYLKKLKL